jgi:hypothetical protein
MLRNASPANGKCLQFYKGFHDHYCQFPSADLTFSAYSGHLFHEPDSPEWQVFTIPQCAVSGR